jgi:hypothetical protein
VLARARGVFIELPRVMRADLVLTDSEGWEEQGSFVGATGK